MRTPWCGWARENIIRTRTFMKYYLNRHRLGVQMMIVALLWLLSSGALTTTGNLVLVNYLEKRLLMTSPKAGATIAAMPKWFPLSNHHIEHLFATY